PPDIVRWGTSGGITAYSVGATACNIGTCWAQWNGSTNAHPVMGVNAFELKDGRFLQIGQQWVKHTFAADYADFCGTCLDPQDFSRMGVSCSDLYQAAQNRAQRRMASKSSIDPHTGVYVYNPASFNQDGNAIYKRLQIHNFDLDPGLNRCARYFIEVQYISPDDAVSGNGDNNASYRRFAVSV